MNLIDLLVQELPGRGGWPQWAVEAVYYGRLKEVRFWDSDGNYISNDGLSEFHSTKIDAEHEEVTRQQYESALASSQKATWDGSDLPPEGIECEVKSGKDSWTLCKVVHSSSAGVAFIYLEEPSGESSSKYLGVLDCIPRKHAGSYFRPIRTEEERKREELIDSIANLCHRGDPGDDATAIYDAIAAGKIPGIRLE